MGADILFAFFFLSTYVFVQSCLVLFQELLHLLGEVVPLALQLFVQPQPVLIHLPLQLILQGHQVLLMLPPHAFVPRHLLTQLRVLLMFLHLTGHLQDFRTKRRLARAAQGLCFPSEFPNNDEAKAPTHIPSRIPYTQVEDKVNDPKLTIAMMLKLRFINPFFNFKLTATQTCSRLATDVETEHQNLEVPKVNVGPTW